MMASPVSRADRPEQRLVLGISRRVAMTLFATFVASFFIGLTPGFAHANWGPGEVGYFGPVYGHSYANHADVLTSTKNAKAYTYTGPSGSSVASGWVGSRGRLFIGTTGTVMSCQGATTYSTQTMTSGSYWSGISCTRFTTGSWYSYGVSEAFNGSGYNSFYTFRSSNQNS